MKRRWKESWQIITEKERTRREKVVAGLSIVVWFMVIAVAAYLSRAGYIAMVPRDYGRSEYYGILIAIPIVLAFLLRRLLAGLYGEKILFDAIPIVITGLSITMFFCYLFDIAR
jgi:hypothetical protein